MFVFVFVLNNNNYNYNNYNNNNSNKLDLNQETRFTIYALKWTSLLQNRALKLDV